MGPSRRQALTAVGVGIALTAAAAPAHGRIVEYPSVVAGAADIREYPRDPSATPVARAMVRDESIIRRAVFSALPPASKPAAVSTTRLAGFPRRGERFAILSTGNATYADDPDESGDKGAQSQGPSIRGARDVLIMRVDMRIPRGVNCLSFRFRFLSEEFPEFVDDDFNDAFIAELGRSSWTAGTKDDPAIDAPRNFARDSNGNPIRVNRVGDYSVSARRARGTTYDAATRVLRASTRIKPGKRKLYLSIFDQGDRIYDSAVFIDNLVVGRRSKCRTGAVVTN
jgi:hypothetical protein